MIAPGRRGVQVPLGVWGQGRRPSLPSSVVASLWGSHACDPVGVDQLPISLPVSKKRTTLRSLSVEAESREPAGRGRVSCAFRPGLPFAVQGHSTVPTTLPVLNTDSLLGRAACGMSVPLEDGPQMRVLEAHVWCVERNRAFS